MTPNPRLKRIFIRPTTPAVETNTPVPGLAHPAPDQVRDLAIRLGWILVGLAALVARKFPRYIRLLPLVCRVWSRVSTANMRFIRLTGLVAAGRWSNRAPATTVRQTTPTPRAERPPAPSYPTAHGWIVHAIGWEAAGYTCQLEHLLADPAMVAFIAATPAAARILRPIVHMLGADPGPGLPGIPRPCPRPIPQPQPQPEPPSGPRYILIGYDPFRAPSPSYSHCDHVRLSWLPEIEKKLACD